MPCGCGGSCCLFPWSEAPRRPAAAARPVGYRPAHQQGLCPPGTVYRKVARRGQVVGQCLSMGVSGGGDVNIRNPGGGFGKNNQ